MVKLSGYSYDVGYPIYGAKFVEDSTLVVAGGGGEGKNGIPNRMTALIINPDKPKKPIKKFRESQLAEDEDCAMSMDANNNVILLGVNQNSSMIKKGTNAHLRKYKYVNQHLKHVASAQISPNKDSSIYQKLTYVSPDGSYGVIAMSDDPSSLYVVDTNDLSEKFKIVTGGDVKDICISPDGKMLCYITSTVFEAISTITGRPVFRKDDFKEFSLSKIEFLDNNNVIFASVPKNGSGGIILSEFSIAKSSTVKGATVCRNMKGLTSMAIYAKDGLLAISGSDCSISIFRLKDFSLIKTISKVHGFAITKIVFSPNGKFLASVSAANSISVLVIPPNLATSKSMVMSVFQTLISIILIAILGIGIQYCYNNGYIDKLIDMAKKPKQDSSSYFTIQPIGESETFLKGPPSETTYLPEDLILLSLNDDIVTTASSDIDAFSSSLESIISDDLLSLSEIVTESKETAVEIEPSESTGIDTPIETPIEKPIEKPIDEEILNETNETVETDETVETLETSPDEEEEETEEVEDIETNEEEEQIVEAEGEIEEEDVEKDVEEEVEVEEKEEVEGDIEQIAEDNSNTI
ncbi:unnamed protein product [[Candida] boidinii]|uniref:Unnamed protein product n=1 Tax=Candida boidinii TaxID=5477 RepID=A0ACB5TRU3_CANBO|nr:unnamed protein product [[Candida] boidinii]